ncbi:MAG: hypothetical protein ABI637_09970 [Gemmatimonadota bacterium]
MRVLFVGNSFTARNDLPGMLARMAAARGHVLQHDLIQQGGASLRAHWNRGTVVHAMRHKHYDIIVLQEQSTLPVRNARRMHENVRLFTEMIDETGARAALYMTWAKRNAPETQQAITAAYTAIARETGALLVPVGNAWTRYLESHETPALHDRDMSHPAPAGTYLAACVFHAVLFEESAVGLPCEVPGLTPAAAAAMQRAADGAVADGAPGSDGATSPNA